MLVVSRKKHDTIDIDGSIHVEVISHMKDLVWVKLLTPRSLSVTAGSKKELRGKVAELVEREADDRAGPAQPGYWHARIRSAGGRDHPGRDRCGFVASVVLRRGARGHDCCCAYEAGTRARGAEQRAELVAIHGAGRAFEARPGHRGSGFAPG